MLAGIMLLNRALRPRKALLLKLEVHENCVERIEKKLITAGELNG